MALDSALRLVNSILSMDTYNRGYNAAIDLRPRDSYGNLILDGDGNPIASDKLGTLIGDYTIYASKGDSSAQNIGFYAVAYEDVTTHKITVAYRGTDDFIARFNPNTGLPELSTDVLNGYGLGATDADVPQSRAAIEFYKAVAESQNSAVVSDPELLYQAGIIVTGHSMGGGLAGFVGAVYHQEGNIFDNMAFKTAANNLSFYNVDGQGNKVSLYPDPDGSSGDLLSIYKLINGTEGTVKEDGTLDTNWTSGKYKADFSGLDASYVKGEALDYVPIGGHGGQTDPTPDDLEMHFSDPAIDMFDLHNVATLVIRMFADPASGGEVSATGDWVTSAKYFWPVLYDNAFAYSIGMQVAGRYGDETITSGSGENIATSHGIDKDMRTMIAYSALDEHDIQGYATMTDTELKARLPFGDTGIRALYDDANDLGNVLTAYGSGTEQSHISGFITNELVETLDGNNNITESPHLAQAFVEYAAELAKAQVLQLDHAGALNGVLTFNNTASDHSLAVNFSDDLWGIDGLNVLPEATPQEPNILSRETIFNDVMSNTDIVSEQGVATIQQYMMPNWLQEGTQDTLSNTIKQIIFAADADGGSVKIHEVNDGVVSAVSMLVGSAGDDVIAGSAGGDLVFGGEGDDTYSRQNVTGSFFNGGAGQNTIDYSLSTAPIIVGLGFGEEVTGGVSQVDVYRRDAFQSVEHFIGTDGDDAFYISGGDPGGTPPVVEGGSGNDTYTIYLLGEDIEAGTVLITEGAGGGTNDSLIIEDSGGPFDTTISTEAPTMIDGVSYTGVIVQDGQGNHAEVLLDKAAIDTGNGLDTIEFVGYEFAAKDFIDNIVTMTADGPITREDLADLWRDLYSSTSGGTGYGGGTTVYDDGNGNITGQTVDKTMTASGSVSNGGGVIAYASGNEVFHPFVVTGASTSTSGTTTTSHVTYQTATQEVDLIGVTQDDIRFTLSGSQGDANLTVNITSLNTSFTINDFETGKEISGVAVLNEQVHQAVQTGDSSSLVATGIGAFTGDYAGGDVYSLIDFGSVDVTYFFESLKTLGDGHVFDMQDTVTFTGTSGGESLMGLDNRGDIINGLAGNDTIHAYGGDDVLNGGVGSDYLYGGYGDDVYAFSAGDGSDTVSENASQGTDTILLHGVDPGDVHLWTANSSASLHVAYSATDDITITGGSYNSSGVTVGSVEQVKFDDGTTWDLTGGLHLVANTATASVYGTGFGDTIEGGTETNILFGYGGDDVLTGHEGNDYLYGGQGDDVYAFSAGDGTDTVSENANQGTDTIALHGVDPGDVHLWTANSSNSLHISYSATDDITITGGSYNSSGVTVGSVEQVKFDDGTTWDLTSGLHLVANTANATIYGTGFADMLEGGTGGDSLNAYGGDDVLNGGAGHDYLYGGQGDDTYVFNLGDSSASGGDTVTENANQGMDTILLHGVDPGDAHLWTANSSASLHVAYSATDDITITGGSYSSAGIAVGSVEEVKFDDGTTWDLTGGLHLVANTANATIYGTGFADMLDGGTGADSLNAYGGDDVLNGGAGHDYLYGGQGDDTYVFNLGDSSASGGDTVTENANQGTDTILLHGADPGDVHLWTANSSASLHVAYSATDDITITGGSYNSAGVTVGSVEQVKFDDGTTWDLTGGLHLVANTASASVYGTAFNDVIEGQSGGNFLYGYGGDDVLVGNGGTDYFSGGAGADTFVLTDAVNSSTIADFSAAAGDVIDISSVLSGYDPVNDALSDFVQLTTSGSSTLLKVDIDGAGTGHAMAQIATISGVTGLDLNSLVANGNLIVHAAAA
jgi:Ca2+-binding RTX toxin-like protein